MDEPQYLDLPNPSELEFKKLTRRAADFPWTEIMRQLRWIWLKGPPIPADAVEVSRRQLAELELEADDLDQPLVLVKGDERMELELVKEAHSLVDDGFIVEGADEPIRRTSKLLAEYLETEDTTVSGWSSHARSRRKPPEWAISRMLLMTNRRLEMNGTTIRIVEMTDAVD